MVILIYCAVAYVGFWRDDFNLEDFHIILYYISILLLFPCTVNNLSHSYNTFNLRTLHKHPLHIKFGEYQWKKGLRTTFSLTTTAAPLLGPQVPSSGDLENYNLIVALMKCVCGGVSLRVQSAQLAFVIDWGKKVTHNFVTDQRQHSRSACLHAFTRVWLQISYYSYWTSQDFWPPTASAPTAFTPCALMLFAKSSVYDFYVLQYFHKYTQPTLQCSLDITIWLSSCIKQKKSKDR